MGQRAKTSRQKFNIIRAARAAAGDAFGARTSAKSRRLLVRLLRDEAGISLIPMTLMLPVMVGFAGLGTEAGLWLYSHQSLQAAADAAAVSGALDVNSSSADVTTQADAISAQYGFANGTGGVTVTVNHPPTGSLNGYNGNTAAVEVIITRPQTRLLSAFFGSGSPNITARAVGFLNSTSSSCLLALNGTASQAINASGGATTTLSGCGIFSDSNSTTSIKVSGGSTITTVSAGTVGQVSLSGGGTINASRGITQHAAALSDPYGNVPFPSHGTCTSLPNYNSSTLATINPGTYCGMNISSTAQVTMNAGTYIFTGNVNVSGSGTLTGTAGVTLAFAGNASASFSGGSVVRLTAPTTGTYAGMIMFGDRSMTIGTAFSLSGGGSFLYTGAIYMPKASVSISGGSSAGSPTCNQVIADTITLTGSGRFASGCVGTGVKPIGASAMLVE